MIFINISYSIDTILLTLCLLTFQQEKKAVGVFVNGDNSGTRHHGTVFIGAYGW